MDWIACIFELTGAWLVGSKKKLGFIVFMIGNVFWFLAGRSNDLGGLQLVGIIFFLINVRNYRKWSQEK